MDKITLQRINKIHPLLRGEVKEICTECWSEGIHIRITDGFRTPEQQDGLFAKGRTKPGRIVTNVKGGNSYHNYGLACFDDKTEALTDEGWKFFKDLNRNESIMVFKDDTLFYENPLAFISNEYNGEMISIKSRSIDLLVTPNHKMIVKRKTTNKWDAKWSEKQAFELDYKYKIPTSGEFLYDYIEHKIPFDICDSKTWWEFMGWYISEGSACGVSDGIKRTHNGRFKISISQKKDRKEWYLIKECLDRMKIHYNYIGHEFIIHSKKLHTHLFELGHQLKRYIPRYLFNADKEHLTLLFNSLIDGDGSIYDNRYAYWTSSNKLANDVSELMILLGYSASIRIKIPKIHMMPQGKLLKTINTQYCVITRPSKPQELRTGNNNNKCFSKEYYKGTVYCVTMPSGTIVVKRNGKIAVTGNCDFCLITDEKKASWNYKHENWTKIVQKFKAKKWEWGGDWQGFKDRPHLQKTFGKKINELKYLKEQGQVDENGYIKI